MLCLFHEKHIYAFNSTHGRTAINKKAAKLLHPKSHNSHLFRQHGATADDDEAEK